MIAPVAEWRRQAVLMTEEYEFEMLCLGATGYFASFFNSSCESVSMLGPMAKCSESGKETHGGGVRGPNSPGLMERASKLGQGERLKKFNVRLDCAHFVSGKTLTS
jgi:hypothetical protein